MAPFCLLNYFFLHFGNLNHLKLGGLRGMFVELSSDKHVYFSDVLLNSHRERGGALKEAEVFLRMRWPVHFLRVHAGLWARLLWPRADGLTAQGSHDTQERYGALQPISRQSAHTADAAARFHSGALTQVLSQTRPTRKQPLTPERAIH